MIGLRRLDRQGLQDYVQELMPRFLVVRLRAKGVGFRWAVPSWAIEEVMRFALRAAPLTPRAIGLLPDRLSHRIRRFVPRTGGRRTLALLDEFFSERHRDLLVLPPGEPFVAIETTDVLIEIKPYVLGAR